MTRRYSISCSNQADHGEECDCAWVSQQMQNVPRALHHVVQAKYNASGTRNARNTFLRMYTQESPAARMKHPQFKWPYLVDHTTNDGEVAQRKRHIDVDLSTFMMDIASCADDEIRNKANTICTYLLTPNHPKYSDLPYIEPLSLEKRLRRYLRKAAHQQSEMHALSLGLVHRDGQEYASNMSHDRRRDQLDASKEWAEQTEVIMPNGQRIILDDIIVSNKNARFAQIYSWSKGLENYSRSQGHVPLFLTITAPPRFHPAPSLGVNSWDGSTPAEAQQWLMTQFARLRARLAKKNITLSGLRVAEPHQDACPHGHLLTFVHPKDRAQIEEEIRFTWPTDAAAKIKWLDNQTSNNGKKASAASYVMKYVMKTLGNGKDGSEKVDDKQDTWRASWGVRAIQWIGLPTKQTWEALRRLPPERARDPELSLLRYAAQENNYALFLELNGGAGIKLKDRTLRTRIQPDRKFKIMNFRIRNEIVTIWQRAKAKIERIKNNVELEKVTVILNYPRKPENQGQNPNLTLFFRQKIDFIAGGGPPPSLAIG